MCGGCQRVTAEVPNGSPVARGLPQARQVKVGQEVVLAAAIAYVEIEIGKQRASLYSPRPIS